MDMLAPGGLLWRTDAGGKHWERVAGELRNPYDLAISKAGQIFTCAADLEWDVRAP
jgi:photosystem II stability/assembly factor-like uncharacterized protein